MGGEWRRVGYLRGEVLEDGGEVDGGAAADALGVLAGLEVARDAADGELQPGLGRPRHGLGALGLAPAADGTHPRRLFSSGTGLPRRNRWLAGWLAGAGGGIF